MKFSEETDRVLRDAGWHPGRAIETTAWRRELESSGFQMHDAAENFLSEFGGLMVDMRGPGISCARVPFELDPMLCLGEDDRFSEWSVSVGSAIFPLGELDQGRFFLGIDENGMVYIVVDWLARLGYWPEALERLALGIAADPVPEDGEC